MSLFVLQHQKTFLWTCAASKVSDQPAHLHSLIRIFTGHILDSNGCKVSSCGQQRLGSVCTDAPTDLSLCLAQSEGMFSLLEIHLSYLP